MPEHGLSGRVALVTGGGRGLGRAHALALADRGAAVVVNDLGADIHGHGHDGAPATSVVSEIEAVGGLAVADLTDIASLAGGRQAVTAAIEHFGRIDIVVNNAGFPLGGGSVAHPVPIELEALFQVHLAAALGTMSAAIEDMRTREWGRIINTVSEAALDARFVGALGYGAAKAALWAATLAGAAEVASLGITINAVSPGARTRLNAELLDQGFRGNAPTLDLNPAKVAAVVAYLASEEAGDITGKVIHAAGGEVREYSTTRSGRTDLAQRISKASTGL